MENSNNCRSLVWIFVWLIRTKTISTLEKHASVVTSTVQLTHQEGDVAEEEVVVAMAPVSVGSPCSPTSPTLGISVIALLTISTAKLPAIPVSVVVLVTVSATDATVSRGTPGTTVNGALLSSPVVYKTAYHWLKAASTVY
jgi:hypothetical protein